MDKNIDLISNPKKSLWKLSVPLMAFCIFDAIYGLVDMLWVSRISVEAFYAIGISIPITSLIFSFGDSIGQGTNSMISRFIGSGDYESGYNTLIHGIIIANIVWLILLALFLFTRGILFNINPKDSYILIFDYLAPMVFFAYIFILNNLFSETFQAEGNSHTPTILIVGSSILNIILDPIFIFYFNMGIKGAAYASVLSSLIAFIILLYFYLSGRTKIPLSLKYFKYNSYIIIEIFKVTLPNFIDDAYWSFAMSYVNILLIMTMGEMGPIIYSVSDKIRTLLIAPIRGFSRGLMSISGHLFGAELFDEIEEMFNYALKISICTSLIIMIVFLLIRNQVFALLSITGMEETIFWITIGGIIVITTSAITRISTKMLDGFGKSLYTLLITSCKLVFEAIIIYRLANYIPNDYPILIGIIISDALFSLIYYKFLKYLFNHFDEEYKLKYTVRTFTIKRKDKVQKILAKRREKIKQRREGSRERRGIIQKKKEAISAKAQEKKEAINERKEKRNNQ